MTTEQITITHHPATDTAPQHWRSSDDAWSPDGSIWIDIVSSVPMINLREHRAAFFAQILNAETEPGWAKVGDWVRGVFAGEIIVGYVDNLGVKRDSESSYFAFHNQYTIVDPPQRLTAKGKDITQKDGVWERKWSDGSISRYCVRNGRIIVKLDSSGMFSDGYPAKSATYTHISDDPRDLTDWGVE